MYQVTAFYHFVHFDDPRFLKYSLLKLCEDKKIKGTILLAQEGINGTISGSSLAVNEVLNYICTFPKCSDLCWKTSWSSHLPFSRMKVRLKAEIVTMGQPNVNPALCTGRYVKPEDWNQFVNDPETIVIDTRNHYEVAIGTFDGAVNPQINSFREFPDWWEHQHKNFDAKKIAMFCTGGIRCEKATNFLLGKGEMEVYHLKGGILKYLEDIPRQESLWRGSCFVFDYRVSLDHDLLEGRHLLCHGCRHPITPEDTRRPEYEPGVSCHHCIDKTSKADKMRFRERQKQICLAKEREHLSG
ncbi:MAG: rhodanese-related sulfurtransferase [Aestuariivita sp.]|nr:rhodanese-related sulfurtransferase [Aestuariivita sp.]